MASPNPQIYKEDQLSQQELESLKKTCSLLLDIFENQLEEFLEITFPNPAERESKRDTFVKERTGTNQSNKGTWVYYPWSKHLIHILNDVDLFSLRTNRNRELVTIDEENKIKEFNIGIAGLSIGSNLASALSHLGARNFKLADFDKLATSNLNRVSATLLDLDKNKAILTAERIYETDPYSKIEVFDEGINKNNLADFLVGSRRLGVVVDSIDDFEMKIRLRQLSRENKIPVLMFTNLGDSTLVDIERYDQQPDLEIFNGLLADVPEEILNSDMTEENKKRFAAKLVGIENVPTKALKSLLKMGTDLVGRPQLASTVATSAGLATFAIRQVALEEDCPSGRYLVHYPTAIFSNDTKDPYKSDPDRQEILSRLMKG